MLTLYVNEKSDEGRSVIEFIKNLHAPASSIKVKKLIRELSDEEMALPGFQPTDEELEAWLIKPDAGKGIKAATLRNKLIKKLHSESRIFPIRVRLS
jgi:hypothetical protein